MLKEWAKNYIKHYNWNIIPVHFKVPVLPTWKEYETKRVTEEDIDRWFKEYGDNITGLALICGAISDITVLDFDKEKDKDGKVIPESKLPSILNDMKPTCMTKTGTEGMHLIYKYFPKLNGIQKLVPRVDIKSEGGYVLLPPSQHENGNKYKFIVSPNSIIAELDDSILRYIKRDTSGNEIKPKTDWSTVINGASQGERNNTAAKIIGKMLNDTSPEMWDLVVIPAMKAWNENNIPPMSNKELFSVYNSIKRMKAQQILKSKTEKVVETGEVKKIITTEEVINKANIFLFDPRPTELITTGYLEVDNLLGGIFPHEFIILAGNSGSGKSIYAFNWALQNCNKIKTLFISGEMMSEILLTRYLQNKTSINSREVVSQQYSGKEIKLKEELKKFGEQYKDLTFINRDFDLTTDLIEQVIVENDIKLVFIDHLRYIKREGKDQFEALDKIVTSLQQMGQKYNCVIILLAHYVKDNQYDGSKPQILDKLYGGVSIQREATKVLQLWHQPLYGDDISYSPVYSPTRFILQKNRYGEEGNAWLKFNLVKGEYESMSLEEIQEAQGYQSTFVAKKRQKNVMVDVVKEFE